MLKAVFNILRGVIRWARRSILLIGCIFFLGINFLTLTSGFMHEALSSALGYAGIETVSSMFDKKLRREKGVNKSLKKKVYKLSKGRSSVRKLGGKVSSRTLKSAGLNVASIPAESAPWAGIAVILTVTAAELHMACDNISDMNRIFEALDITQEEDPNVAIETCLGYIEMLEKIKRNLKENF